MGNQKIVREDERMDPDLTESMNSLFPALDNYRSAKDCLLEFQLDKRKGSTKNDENEVLSNLNRQIEQLRAKQGFLQNLLEEKENEVTRAEKNYDFWDRFYMFHPDYLMFAFSMTFILCFFIFLTDDLLLSKRWHWLSPIASISQYLRS